jgi:outer membrane protein assembly factor BamB
MDFASSAGMLATDGGLLFTGKLTGEVIALDIDNGKELWLELPADGKFRMEPCRAALPKKRPTFIKRAPACSLSTKLQSSRANSGCMRP